MGLQFTKMQGCGNDFILVANDDTQDWASLARAICDRHYGVGGDGLLVLLPSDVADFRMRMFNPDGSEAEACGNGLRCFARYILENKLTGGETDQMLVETVAGTRTVRFNRAKEKATAIQVSMGKPEFASSKVPVRIPRGKDSTDGAPILDYPLAIGTVKLSLSFVSMGNPHAIHFSEHPVADFPLADVGPKGEHHRIFPNRRNFEVANVISRRLIEARVWERGAGETLACGSGAAAIAVAARLHGYVGSEVNIKLPGGVLGVQWDGVGEVFLSGPAEVVFTAEWPTEV